MLIFWMNSELQCSTLMTLPDEMRQRAASRAALMPMVWLIVVVIAIVIRGIVALGLLR